MSDNDDPESKKIHIAPEDRAGVAEQFNMMTKRVDGSRMAFSSVTLTLYATITSGLVVLANSLEFPNTYQQVSFMVIVVTSVLIVMCCLLERFGSFIIDRQIADAAFAHIRKTGKAFTGPISGKPWQSKLVSFQAYAILVLFLFNLIAVLVYTSLKVFA
jgi:hypothetical protein